MKYLFGLLVFLAMTVASASEPAHEDVAVRETIQSYLDGYAEGDVDKLKRAFRQDVVIKYISPWDGKYTELSMPQLNEFMGKLPARWEVTSRIDSLDVHGNAASAKVTAQIAGSVTWTDFLTLLKIDGKWWITGKVTHGDLQRRTNIKMKE